MKVNLASILLILTYALPLGGFMVTFTLFYLGDDSFNGTKQTPDVPLSFLSDSINYYPGQNIGALIISTGAAFLVSVMLVRHHEINLRAKQFLPSTSPKRVTVRRVQVAALVIGIIAAIGSNGVAAFQEHVNMTVHLSMAGLFFGGGTLYILLHVYLDIALQLESKCLRTLRLMQGIVLIFTTALTLVFNRIHVKDADEARVFIQISAGFEISTFLIYLSYFMSHHANFKKLDISLRADDMYPSHPAGRPLIDKRV